MYWGLRASKAVRVNADTGELEDVSVELFNNAHPELVLDRVDRGASIRILGLRPAPIAFTVPREVPLAQIRIGKGGFEAFGEMDGVFFWADAGRLVITWRARFRYPVRLEEIRRADLTFVE
jgi:hypothetical protein